MGLRPVLGRLLNAADDGPAAAGAVVLTHRFWTTVLQSDPAVIGQTIRLGPSAATVVGVLEPSVPYPEETQIIANMVTSPHHLGATMNTDRRHRMTELFGRLAPGATLEAARAELTSVHASMMREHPEAYSAQAQVQLQVRTLRDQLASPARTILLVLLAAAAVVFVIACSNVANLILARSVRREAELAVRAALGAGRGALRRTLLAESLVLCAAGAVLGLMLAEPLVTRGGAAMPRAFPFARSKPRWTPACSGSGRGWRSWRPCCSPTFHGSRHPIGRAVWGWPAAACGSRQARTAVCGSLRRLRSRVRSCCWRAPACWSRRSRHCRPRTPATTCDRSWRSTFHRRRRASATQRRHDFFREATRRIGELPGVQGVAAGVIVPWRDRSAGSSVQFAAEGYQPADGEENPTGSVAGRLAWILRRARRPDPRGPRLYGRGPQRHRTRGHRQPERGAAPVPERRRAQSTSVGWGHRGTPQPRRIVGIVADVDDENVVQEPSMTVYEPIRGEAGDLASRLFVRAAGDPYALVPSVTRTIREISADQAVERPATLEDVRAEVLTPERLNAFVFSALGGIALLIAVVGVAGVLAFSVSARTREFGVRLAVGSTPRDLRAGVLRDGVRIAAIGIAAGAAGGYALARVAEGLFGTVQLPGALPVIGAAVVLIGAAIVASLMPATRASRVDVLQALRSE